MQTYKISAFARMAGVTVRTLQHYDRTGILSPAQRTESGYRLYTISDLFRLQQIRTLKWMGFSLKEAAGLLDGESYAVVSILRLQREAIVKRARELSEAAIVLERMIEKLLDDKDTSFDPGEMSSVLKAVESEYARSWFEGFLSDEQLAHLKEYEGIKTHQKAWNELWQALHAAFAQNRKPEDPEVQQIAGKMRMLTSELAKEFSDLRPSLRAMGEDYLARKEGMPPFMKVDPEMSAFFMAAMQHNQPGT